MPRRLELLLITSILLLAAGLRFYQLGHLPPGWRDDEIVETTVHAQVVLEGHGPLYFPQAEGHEPLFHYLSAGWIALVGRSLLSVRLLSALFGVFSVAALYRLTRRAFGPGPALLAALGLSISFWGLMYARFKLRHIGMVGFMLLAFDAFLQGPARAKPAPFIQSALWLTLALYTYFAARALPLILLAWVGYLAFFNWPTLKRGARTWALVAALSGVLCLPLIWAVAQLPGGEARLAVVGGPLQALLHGDPGPVFANTRDTLGMFAFTGDPEYLYNIPNRPIFEGVGATLFLGGVLLALWRWQQPRYAFLLIWALGGVAPAFVSVPAASLGHTIVAQPVTYIFPALALAQLFSSLRQVRASPIPVGWWAVGLSLVPILFFVRAAQRDWHDYFSVWPNLPEVRYLYRADLHTAAPALRALPTSSDVVLASRLLHPADALAITLESPANALHPRLYQPPWVSFFPNQSVPLLLEGTGLTTTLAPFQAQHPLTAIFANGWEFMGYTLVVDAAEQRLQLTTQWRITASYSPPPPRPVEHLAGTPLPLKLFTHLLTPNGEWVAGDDRLNLDPAWLRTDDEFVQRFELVWPAGLAGGDYTLALGLYNPETGERVLLVDGADHVNLTTVPVP